MANLVQAAEELEFVPKNQLAQMSQDANSRYPTFLVLSEIQRRTQMERMYNAERQAMEMPTTTVAEELVGEFMQPQGLAGMGVNGSAEAPTADVFSPGQPMPASPMQYAASGGRTGFQNIGSTSQGSIYPSRQSLLASLGINPSGMTEEEIQQTLLQGGVQRGIRNNNPLNIRYDPANDWQGQIGKDDEGFSIFETPDHAMRAGDIILGNYDHLHGIDTISDAMERFAPLSDNNDPEAYAGFVASRTGMGADQRIDLGDPTTRQSILTAQASFETPQTETLTGEAPTLSQADLQSYQAAREAQQGAPTVPQLGDTDDSGGLGGWARERYFGDDDKFNFGTAALDASLFIPGFGLLAGAGARGAILGARALKAAHAAGKFGEWGRRGAQAVRTGAQAIGRGTRTGAQATGRGFTASQRAQATGAQATGAQATGRGARAAAEAIGRGLRATVTRPGTSPRTVDAARRKVVDDARRRAVDEARRRAGLPPGGGPTGSNLPVPMGRNPLVPMGPQLIPGGGRVFSARRAGATGLGLLAAGTTAEYMMDDDEVEEKVAQIVNPPGGDPELEKSTRGLSGKVNSYLSQADPLDVAKLGGIIMSSRNTVDLGEGITALAQDIQTRKTEDEARQDELQLRDIQGELYQAQTEKVRAEIENMPLDRVNDLLKSYAAYAKAVAEGAYHQTEAEAAEFDTSYRLLIQKASELQGLGSSLDDPVDPYTAAGATVGP